MHVEARHHALRAAHAASSTTGWASLNEKNDGADQLEIGWSARRRRHHLSALLGRRDGQRRPRTDRQRDEYGEM